MQDFEKLGSFYLGRIWDSETGATTSTPLMYDSPDLTTHAVCVGMTGSGKTGLCISLLEEAAIDGIPAIAIDPKGDLGNLLLTFPQLRGSDFQPWIDEGEAARNGLSAEAWAEQVAATWRKGLSDWGQDGGRIDRLRKAVDLAIYTPGSTAGLPLTVLRSFAPPPPAIAKDAELVRERLEAAVSGLLSLLDLDAQARQSPEHVLLSTILDRAWGAGRAVDLGGLIREIQTPGFEHVGVMDLETFFPSRDRTALAMRLNALLAAPGFAGWLEGPPLDVGHLLWTPEGRPRISILSIAHLPESERIFFVTILLNEIVAWVRSQSGTSSLRALLYMDEIFGYFPPSANPPSKLPMLTLLKQARAHGLGLVLATQNPVDLDYKGLSNAGTWFLGRLQTERDKARVLDGLEGSAASASGGFDRARIDSILSGLGKRVFLLHNVHEPAPVLFQTRWAMSYLRGPLTRAHIRSLTADRPTAAAPPAPAVAASPSAPIGAASAPPALPAEIRQRFWRSRTGTSDAPTYRPGLLGQARLHFIDRGLDLDRWEDLWLLAPVETATIDSPWSRSEPFNGADLLEDAPWPGARYSTLPVEAQRPATFRKWSGALEDHLYRHRTLNLFAAPASKMTSNPAESEGDFRVRVAHVARERRDEKLAMLRARHAPAIEALQERLRRAEAKTERERSQYEGQRTQAVVSIGATVLGALFGRKLTSVGNIGRATTAARGASRAARERQDIAAAEENEHAIRDKFAELEQEIEAAVATISTLPDPSSIELERKTVPPRKSDIQIASLELLWIAD